MKTQFYLNQMGYPKIAEMDAQEEIPVIGEKIELNIQSRSNNYYEVTDVKKDVNRDDIYIYVNPINT